MLSAQPHFVEFQIRPLLLLSEVEDLLRVYSIFHTLPSRKTLIEWVEDGTLEGKKIGGRIYVFEDSFESWLKEIQQPVAA